MNSSIDLLVSVMKISLILCLIFKTTFCLRSSHVNYKIPANFTNFANQFFDSRQNSINHLFQSSIGGSLPLWIFENEISHKKIAMQRIPKNEYDFIIVGGGSAGSVVASRLSENPLVTVLVVEAGGPENILTDIPFATSLLAASHKDWAYVTESQQNAFLNMEKQSAKWESGKSMGGSSAINGMVYDCGNPNDYDNWAKLGAHNWSYTDVLPYFKKSERNMNQNYRLNGFHGTEGPLPVTSNALKNRNPFGRKTVESCHELGFDIIDLNAYKTRGTNLAQQLIYRGNRVSVSKAYIESVKDQRNNLDVITYSEATKILFNKNKRATSLEFVRFGKQFSVNAKKEIILSAGTIGSPKLLLLSGIGPEVELKKLGIKAIHNLPGVGENLHDHVYAIGPILQTPVAENPMSLKSFIQYARSRTGPLAFLDVPQCYSNSSVNRNNNWPDIQVMGIGASFTYDTTGVMAHNMYGLKRDIFMKMYLPYIDTNQSHLMLQSGITRPKSRGKLTLKSRNPFEYPRLEPNYLSHSDDVIALSEALKWTYRMIQTNAYKTIGAKVMPYLVIGCEDKYRLVNDHKYPQFQVPNHEYLKCCARHMTISGLHFVGTCKMGSASDRLAVVDSKLKVLGGIESLRVIDASIMPAIIDANTNAAVVMIGERGAQFIKDYYYL